MKKPKISPPGSGLGLSKPGRFGGRPVGKQRSRAFMLTIGGLGVVVLLLMGLLSFRVADTVPGRSYYDIYAEFDEADNLANHYEVRIGGRRAGQVLDPKVKDGKARMLVRLDSEFGPLKSDTKTRVRLRSAVGVRYLDLTPGTKGRDLKPKETIPAKNQIESIPLDAVLGTFDPDTREGVQNFLAELGGATAGNGTNINAALDTARPFFKDLGSLSTAITDREGATKSLINGAGRFMATFDAVRDEVAAAFTNGANGARAFADTRDNFHATLDEAPPTLNTLRATLPAVSGLVRQVDGLARQGKPTLDIAPASLRQTTALLREARPSLDEADDTLNLVREASPPTLQLLRRLQPELPDVRGLIDSLLPTVQYIEPRQCELLNFASGWANNLKWGNGSQRTPGEESAFASVHVVTLAGGGGIAGTSANTIPDGRGGNLLDALSEPHAYPGVCDGDNSAEIGAEQPTVAESAQGLRYDFTHQQRLGRKP